MLFQSLPESVHALVELRPIAAADIGDWYSYLSLPVVFEHTSWALASPTELEPFVWAPETMTPSSFLRLAIALRSSGKLVGTIGFHTVSPQNKSAEIAYDLAPQVWGLGIATHLCGRLVSWAHDHAGVVRVQATALETNARSDRVLRRCGFEYEGLLRSYRTVRGAPGNFHMYSHLMTAS
jgi:ribosomal-protein-alanine N-acetyltransferase